MIMRAQGRKTIHRQRKDGASYETIYKSLSYYDGNLPAPTSVDSDNAVPTGWSSNPTGVTQLLPYEYCSKRSKVNGAWGNWSTPKVSARWSQDGTSVAIKYNQKVFKHYADYSDFIAEYPNPYTAGMDYNDFVLLDDATGYSETTEGGQQIVGRNVPTILQYISSPDLTFYLIEPDDGDGVLDSATQNLWMPNGEKWVDCGNIKGPKGDDGDDAVVYELVPSVNVINADADGNITTGAISVEAYKIVGSERSVDLLASGAEGYTAQFAIDNGSWTDCTHEMAAGRRSWYTYIPVASVRSATSRIKFRLLDGNNTVCGVCPDLTIVSNGEKGDKGRMFFLAGEYPPEGDVYTRNDDVCPIVHYAYDSSGTTVDEYWYLDADTNADAYGHAIAPRDQQGNPWKKAEKFGIVITDAMFTAFAKLGSFVISGDFFLSQYGKLIYNNNGTTTTTNINGTNYNVLVDGKLPYTYFDANDPEGSTSPTSGNRKFVPSLNINAKTGRFVGQDCKFTNMTVQGGTFYNIVAQGGSFVNMTAQGGTFNSATVNGNFKSRNNDTLNEVEINVDGGGLLIKGPSHVDDWDHDIPTGPQVTLMKVTFGTDPDSLKRFVYLDLVGGLGDEHLYIYPDGVQYTDEAGGYHYKHWTDILG